jgi:membrane fusion protein, heavy metal efflux system
MKNVFLLFGVLLGLSLPAVAHEGHDKAFGNKDAMVATNQKVHISAEGQAAIGLKAEAVRGERLETSLEITGTVEPSDNRVHYVTSPVPGVISRLTVQENDAVRKGQLLATVYSAEVATVLTDLLDQRGSIQADITKARAQAQNEVQVQSKDVEHFTVDAEREKKLLAEGITARKTYLDALHALDIAKARLEGTKKQVAQNIAALNARQQTVTDATKRKLGIMGVPSSQIQNAIKTGAVIAEVPIFSPAAGIVFSRDVTNGESIDTGKKLISIVNLSPIWVSLNVNQEQLGQIRIGQPVLIKPPVGPHITGKISSIAAVVDPSERTVHVRVVADNNGGVLRPQMFVTARIVTGRQASASIAIPSQAIIEDGGKQWVYVKYGDDFQPVAVTLGDRVGDTTQITDGLYEGDQVVISGARQVRAQAMLSSKTEPKDDHARKADQVATHSAPSNNTLLLLVGVLVGGVAIGLSIAFIAGRFGRRKVHVEEKEKVALSE